MGFDCFIRLAFTISISDVQTERDPKEALESKVEEEMSTNKKALEWSVVFCDIIALQEPYEIGELGTWVPNSLSSLIAYFWFH